MSGTLLDSSIRSNRATELRLLKDMVACADPSLDSVLLLFRCRKHIIIIPTHPVNRCRSKSVVSNWKAPHYPSPAPRLFVPCPTWTIKPVNEWKRVESILGVAYTRWGRRVVIVLWFPSPNCVGHPWIRPSTKVNQWFMKNEETNETWWICSVAFQYFFFCLYRWNFIF